MRTGSAAIAWARAQTHYRTGMCQMFVRSCFGVGSYYGSAVQAWHGAKKRHTLTGDGSSAPAGVPIFWVGGSRGYGHVALGLGHGLCRSTDWPYSGRVGTARISDISRSWNQHLVGWTEDINNVTVYRSAPTRSIDLSNIIRATKHEAKVPQGAFLKRAVAKEVGKGNLNLRTSTLGSAFRAQYKLVQREYLRSIGERVTSSNSDGIPGRASMTWLGKRRGFRVS